MRNLKQPMLALASLGLAAIVVACGTGYGGGAGGNDGAGATATARPPDTISSAPPVTMPPAATALPDGTTVSIGRTGLGSVLVDEKGLTLYVWAHDHGAVSTCGTDCSEYWPPLLTNGMPAAASGVDADLLGTSKRADGQTQVTYGGHPLYYFVQDAKPGDTKGEGLTGFGGRWDPVSKRGEPVTAAAMSAISFVTSAASDSAQVADRQTPLEVRVISPQPGATAGTAGTFSVDVASSERSASSNDLAGYTAGFIDPHSDDFHPGPDAFAPGLVVLMSTTPTIAGTPLRGPNTNLAGVFQVNDIATLHGRTTSFNSWIVGVPGFFGRGIPAELTVYAVRGTAPAVVDGSETPISNVVRETFSIAG